MTDLTYQVDYPIVYWTEQRILRFFNEHSLVISPSFELDANLSTVTFNLDESRQTSAEMVFLNQRPSSLRVYTIVNPKSDDDRKLNVVTRFKAKKIVSDIRAVEAPTFERVNRTFAKMKRMSAIARKAWYYDAVRSALILHKCMPPDKADAILSESKLKQKLEVLPYIVLRDDPIDVADELAERAKSQPGK